MDKDGVNKESNQRLNDSYNANIAKMIELYFELIEKSNQIKKANCSHLNSYLDDSIKFSYSNINEILTK